MIVGTVQLCGKTLAVIYGTGC